MQSVQSVWRDLKTTFPAMSEQQLRLALNKAEHYSQGFTKTLSDDAAIVGARVSSQGMPLQRVHQWICEKQRTDYSERYRERRSLCRWRKFLELKQELCVRMPEKSSAELRRVVRRIARWGYDEINVLTDEEVGLRDVILKHGVKPRTLLKWMIHLIVPEDVREQLEQGALTVCKAESLFGNRERQRRAAMEVQLLEDARRSVREVLS